MNILYILITIIGLFLLASCSDSDSNTSLPVSLTPPPPPAPLTISGSLLDGPVSGGTLFIFSADSVAAVLTAANAAEDRLASLTGASPLATVTLPASEDGAYSIELDPSLANQPVFLVFDNTGAEDLAFGDTPFNMESVAVLGAAGSSATVNVTPHTSMVSLQVRNALPLDATALAAEVTTSTTNVVSAFGKDATGDELLAAGFDLIGSADTEALSRAASDVAAMVRSTAAVTGLDRADILDAMAFDALDGSADGVIPASANVDATVSDRAATIREISSLGASDEVIGIGSCSGTTRLLKRACDVDTMDDFLEGVAVCQDGPADTLDSCLVSARAARAEVKEECAEVYEARLDLCDDLEDAVHEPAFGEAFADNFVEDPRDIGRTVEPNPYLPLVQGNIWRYESTFIDDEGEEVTETVTITVRNATKLIQGINCLVVNDVVEEDGELIEDTDDWLAQDLQGNIWYCGEIAQDYEYFDGDDPEAPELVEIGGSWKAGREGAKAGILVPASPAVGDINRTEIYYNDAEDVAEVIGLTGDESTDNYDCESTCLVLNETTPLEDDADENSYYKPGVGVIVKVDNLSGDREELVSFTNEATTSLLSAAKLLIEHNASDEDTGFQGFADGEPWNELTITDAAGSDILSAETSGGFLDFGVTEFFFETSEPPNDEVPIDDVTERLPEGTYTFTGNHVTDSTPSSRTTSFSHDIPAGPELLTPIADAEEVDPANTVVSWTAVAGDLDDETITIVGYQVIVEQETEPYDPDGFAKPVLSVYLPASVTSVAIPPEFMVNNACYAYEVLAIESTGNQTLAAAEFETGDGCADTEETPDPDGLKAARILIEHNATDEDTGFQGFADGNPWNELVISDPNDTDLLTITPEGGLQNFGLTELFFETSEPQNAEVPIADVLSRLPAGTYTFTAELVAGEESTLTAVLTHTIPAGPVLVSPANEAEDVDAASTVVSWQAVNADLDGNVLTIVGYQVIVEEDLDEEPFPTGFAEPVFSVYLPPTATSVSVPAAFMQSDTDYAWEVLAIEGSGNQTLSSGEFSTLE